MAAQHIWRFAWRRAGWTAWCPCGLAVVVDEAAGPRHGRHWTLDGRPATPEQFGPAQASLFEQRRHWLQEQAAGGHPPLLWDWL